jgi:hypothetical protein
MQTIDIEKLLIWTLREELAKGRPVSACAWDNISHYCALGVRVDVSHHGGDALGFTPGEPHEDAVLVAKAVRELPTRQCIAVDGENNEKNLERVRALLPDAPYLTFLGEYAVMRMTFNLTMLVVSHAVQALRPVYDLGPLIPRPVLSDNNGQPIVVGKRYATSRYSIGAHCPLEIRDPTVKQVMEARATYAVWRIALGQLASKLAGQLDLFEPIGPAAPEEPWVTGEPPAATIVESLLPVTAVPPPAPRPRALKAPAGYGLGKSIPRPEPAVTG